ncbi:lymphokine-activated killer T-cell-originated protein kinase-like [Sitophilus oryzae]|uniref:Lymphokine-activated killer T-cell-originated protein kinase-like n=1 Tax=Sitophilus oryzae TaxID=7048 RepID=A0A6J2XSU9_SITOR|nr:lymphokine-activated killer T-cell-originated protein kinase-like [Sitophilus oryzae]
MRVTNVPEIIWSALLKTRPWSFEEGPSPSPCMKKIGFGTGIAVYELERSPAFNKFRSPWAIKKLIRRNKNNNAIQERLRNEADILRKLVHPNVVGFRAFLENKDGNNILAMEECSSSLGDIIETRSDDEGGPFSPELITKVAQDVAQALNYLHNTALIMHCDVKSYNVLIKGDFVICKLCDFGTCLPLTKNCTRADIYSFGLVIWEMIALCPPVTEDVADSLENCTNMDVAEFDKLLEKMSARSRPPLPTDVELGNKYDKILEIYYCCTDEKMERRPPSEDLVVILDDI